ncbi:MAG: CoA-binding protein [Syntrophomonadaceae bacterium]|nr:CoA-binding protein [Syntrophomonadaceae bacterium]
MLDEGDKIKKRLLNTCKTIAVVGLSDNPRRPSFRIASYLQNQGYRIGPGNPSVTEVMGEKAYPHLREVPGPVDLVSVFRRQGVKEIIQSASEAGIPAVWVQPGIECSDASVQLAGDKQIELIKGVCIMAEHNYLSRQPMD